MEDALDFQAHLRLATRGGVLDELGRGRVLLRDFVENEWWPKDAGRRLERNTLKTYAPVWNVHIGPRLGHLQVRQLNAPVVQAFKEQMESDGVGAPTTRRALAILQAICRYAIAKGELSSNPVREVRKPAVRRKLEIVAISPTQVESLRRALADDPAGQLLVTLIAYEGLRPEEALALTETHRRKSTLLIEQKNVDGQIVPGQKRRRAGNGRDSRSPELFGPVRADIAQYLLAARAAVPSDVTLLFPRADGLPWRDYDYRNWRKRRFKRAVAVAGLPITRPYDLRHACASLLIHAGWPLNQIADHLGNSVATLSAHYAHLASLPTCAGSRHSRSPTRSTKPEPRRCAEAHDDSLAARAQRSWLGAFWGHQALRHGSDAVRRGP